MTNPDDDDKTIELKKPVVDAAPVVAALVDVTPPARPPVARSGGGRKIGVALAALMLTGLNLGAWWYWSPRPAQAPVPAAALADPNPVALSPPPPAAPRGLQSGTEGVDASLDSSSVRPPPPPEPEPKQPEFQIEAATEQHILNHTATERKIFRLAQNPRIVVVDFASLRDQGRMLNRIAAFIEKAGLPRERVLNGDELDAAVRGNGGTVETFYYGHDYDALSLARFFSLADRDKIPLLEEEETLRRLARQENWFAPDARAGLLSIPQVTGDETITRATRAVILRHELSHGEYFTNPAYAAFVRRFWTQSLTGAERDRIRRYLHSQGYDSSLDDMMENEAQAYLMFTDGPELFKPGMIGMSKKRLGELRVVFARDMPTGWLRDTLAQMLNDIRPPAGAAPKP